MTAFPRGRHVPGMQLLAGRCLPDAGAALRMPKHCSSGCSPCAMTLACCRRNTTRISDAWSEIFPRRFPTFRLSIPHTISLAPKSHPINGPASRSRRIDGIECRISYLVGCDALRQLDPFWKIAAAIGRPTRKRSGRRCPSCCGRSLPVPRSGRLSISSRRQALRDRSCVRYCGVSAIQYQAYDNCRIAILNVRVPFQRREHSGKPSPFDR